MCEDLLCVYCGMWCVGICGGYEVIFGVDVFIGGVVV